MSEIERRNLSNKHSIRFLSLKAQTCLPPPHYTNENANLTQLQFSLHKSSLYHQGNCYAELRQLDWHCVNHSVIEKIVSFNFNFRWYCCGRVNELKPHKRKEYK
jgi:hypothetical protein